MLREACIQTASDIRIACLLHFDRSSMTGLHVVLNTFQLSFLPDRKIRQHQWQALV